MEVSELDITLYKYTDAFLGAPASEDHDELARRSDLVRYFRSIIDSNIAPAVKQDESTLVGELQKKRFSGKDEARSALYISRLYGLLKHNSPEYEWWPVLHLLSECSSNTPNAVIASAPSSYLSEQRRQQQPYNREYGGHHNNLRDNPLLPSLRQPQPREQRKSGVGVSRMGPTSAIPRGISGFAGDAAYSPPTQRQHRPESNSSAKKPSSRDEQSTIYLHRELPTYDDIPEAELLQDLIYVLQGIDGTYVRWNRLALSYTVRPDINLSRPTREMVVLVSELGVLARDIQEYIGFVDEQGRLFEQSFSAELKSEMSEYYRLVSELEGRLFKAPRTLWPGESQLGVTLRRMFSWTIEARQRLRLMATAIGKVREGKGGGDVLSAISILVEDGDPFVQTFARRLLKTASAPFNSILVSWVTDGELVDPYKEFFIRERDGRRDMLWGEKYIVVPDMIPVHISGDVTRKIFQIGRSLNFLRVACDEAQWVAEDGPRTQLADNISDSNDLEAFVCRSAVMVNSRLMSVLRDKFELMAHVEAVRRYLLFEQGDFAQALLEVLDNQVDRSGSSIMAHDLSAAMSSVLRSSTMQHEDPQRLAALSLVFVRDDDDKKLKRTWDDVAVFYKLSPPLSYVIPRAAMRKYLEIGYFLLRLNRIEHALHTIWRQQMIEVRAHLRLLELQKRRDRSAAANNNAAGDSQNIMRKAMRECSVACTEMVQFFQQVQRYISLNVIEGAWARFLKATTASNDLGVDKWNEAHMRYVSVIHGVVCGGSNGGGFQGNLSNIFGTASEFIVVARELYSENTLNMRRASAKEPNSKDLGSKYSSLLLDGVSRLRAATNQYNDGQLSADYSNEQATRVHTIILRFRKQVKEILSALSRTTSGDLPFLVVTIDFNKAYTGPE
ncbi:Microtubule-nucleating Tub4p (gamma-tubulin) complex component [Coemansia sp. RSA 1365]|nr:Microtubule-nucleating Tub4p (gamma-tubulin) complex component [Coemansia sp. RSA 1365]